MNKNIKKHLTLGNMLSLIAIVVSIISIIISNNINIKANELTERVNSKEFEISENLKYELLKVVADLKSIESKAALEPLMAIDFDYSKEAESIAKLRTSPGYLILLNSIEDEGDRMMLDANLLMLSGKIEVFSSEFKRAFAHNALEDLKNKTNLGKCMSLKFSDLMMNLFDMRILAPEYEKQEMPFESFVKYLIEKKKIDDNDVLAFYGVIVSDTTIMNKALDAGANIMITGQEIIERYQEEYEAFVNKHLIPNE